MLVIFLADHTMKPEKKLQYSTKTVVISSVAAVVVIGGIAGIVYTQGKFIDLLFFVFTKTFMIDIAMMKSLLKTTFCKIYHLIAIALRID